MPTTTNPQHTSSTSWRTSTSTTCGTTSSKLYQFPFPACPSHRQSKPLSYKSSGNGLQPSSRTSPRTSSTRILIRFLMIMYRILYRDFTKTFDKLHTVTCQNILLKVCSLQINRTHYSSNVTCQNTSPIDFSKLHQFTIADIYTLTFK